MSIREIQAGMYGSATAAPSGTHSSKGGERAAALRPCESCRPISLIPNKAEVEREEEATVCSVHSRTLGLVKTQGVHDVTTKQGRS